MNQVEKKKKSELSHNSTKGSEISDSKCNFHCSECIPPTLLQPQLISVIPNAI